MQIRNQLETQSFSFTVEKPNMQVRSEEIRNLAEVDEYCSSIHESIKYTEDIWNVEVEEGITFVEWLYGVIGEGSFDDRRFLSELISKTGKNTNEIEQQISISLGLYEDSAYDSKSYAFARRKILQEIANPQEFGEFMPSCFVNSVFADDIIHEMKNIKNFSDHTEEIVKNLSILNDEAIFLYEKYHDNLKYAMDILSSKLLECAPDPSHVNALKFSFSYEESIDGENIARNKEIVCSPHLKLVHKGSNLRIYFWWCDSKIGKGEKVLIGRIGGHPY